MVCNREETFAVYQTVLKFDVYLRGVLCTLHCDLKPLEPFLACGMKIPMLDQWYMELSDYNQTFIHIKSTENILMDAISRLKILDIYIEPLDNVKTALNDTKECIVEVGANELQALSVNRLLHARQKKDIHCRDVAAQAHCKNRNSFTPAMISTAGLLQQQQYIYGLKHDVVVAPCTVIPTILHEFNNLKGNQGTICTFKAIRRFYW